MILGGELDSVPTEPDDKVEQDACEDDQAESGLGGRFRRRLFSLDGGVRGGLFVHRDGGFLVSVVGVDGGHLDSNSFCCMMWQWISAVGYSRGRYR